MVEEASATFEVNQNVDVTVRAGLAAGHGPEYADVAGAMAFGYGQDLVAVDFQEGVDPHRAFS